MKTREDLIRRALDKLGVIGAGQNPAQEDVKLLDGAIVPMLSDLAARSVYGFGDPDQIEDAPFEHLATLLANATARDFGKAEDETTRQMAEARLRAIRDPMLTYQTQTVDYF
jgi:hypothetical protein